jgi:hypothetical protein
MASTTLLQPHEGYIEVAKRISRWWGLLEIMRSLRQEAEYGGPCKVVCVIVVVAVGSLTWRRFRRRVHVLCPLHLRLVLLLPLHSPAWQTRNNNNNMFLTNTLQYKYVPDEHVTNLPKKHVTKTFCTWGSRRQLWYTSNKYKTYV